MAQSRGGLRTWSPMLPTALLEAHGATSSEVSTSTSGGWPPLAAPTGEVCAGEAQPAPGTSVGKGGGWRRGERTTTSKRGGCFFLPKPGRQTRSVTAPSLQPRMEAAEVTASSTCVQSPEAQCKLWEPSPSISNSKPDLEAPVRVRPPPPQARTPPKQQGPVLES